MEAIKTVIPAAHQPLTHSLTDMHAALSRLNARKAAGPDGIPISMVLLSALSHLDNTNTYMRMLFVDSIPSKLITKVSDLDINTSLCNWILDFLTNRIQTNHTSSTLTPYTGVPQGCVLSPLHYSLFTYDYTCTWFKHHRQVHRGHNSDWSCQQQRWVGLQGGGAAWCSNNNLGLNTKKTKELLVDYMQSDDGTHTPICINRTEVKRVTTFKFLGVQRLTGVSSSSVYLKRSICLLTFWWTSTIVPSRASLSTVSQCGMATALSLTVKQRVVKTAQRITGSSLPSIKALQSKWCLWKAYSIVKHCS